MRGNDKNSGFEERGLGDHLFVGGSFEKGAGVFGCFDQLGRVLREGCRGFRLLRSALLNLRYQTVLRETLETFITAASAAAQRLAYKVDDISR